MPRFRFARSRVGAIWSDLGVPGDQSMGRRRGSLRVRPLNRQGQLSKTRTASRLDLRVCFSRSLSTILLWRQRKESRQRHPTQRSERLTHATSAKSRNLWVFQHDSIICLLVGHGVNSGAIGERPGPPPQRHAAYFIFGPIDSACARSD
jgi:hypothetical protein